MRPPPAPFTRVAPARGFTLLELLVAITVLAFVSLIAWRGLDSLAHTRERLEPEADEVRALLVAFGQLERDLAQVVKPSFVPISGAPLFVRDGESAGFEMLRLAPAVPGAPSAVQRVIYELRSGQLMRSASLPTDTLGTTTAGSMSSTSLLTDVQSLRVRVWQPGRGWTPPDAATSTAPRGLPPGLEVTVERADGRQYRRVLLVG
jgi:general secretion pathway protein J